MAQTVDAPTEGKDEKAKTTPKPDDIVDELSAEDQELKDQLEGLVTKLQGKDASTVQAAIDDIGKEIRAATTSMTAVPKPLKFLRPHYSTIKGAHSSAPAKCQKPLADVISVLATVSQNDGDRDALAFCLQGSGNDPSLWGHEYISHLAGEIATEQDHRESQNPPQDVDELMTLVQVRSHVSSSTPMSHELQAVTAHQRAHAPCSHMCYLSNCQMPCR